MARARRGLTAANTETATAKSNRNRENDKKNNKNNKNNKQQCPCSAASAAAVFAAEGRAVSAPERSEVPPWPKKSHSSPCTHRGAAVAKEEPQ